MSGECPERGLIEMLAVVADELTGALIAPHDPLQRAMRNRMTAPRPGDLVIETSTKWRALPEERLGRLLACVQETIDADPDDWAPEPLPTERAWYLALYDGRVFRWTNADFVALPAEGCLWPEHWRKGSASLEVVREPANSRTFAAHPSVPDTQEET